MGLRLHNLFTESLETVPAGAAIRLGPGGNPRDAALSELFAAVAVHWDFPVQAAPAKGRPADIFIGPNEPARKAARMWLRAASLDQGDASGAPAGEFSRRGIGAGEIRWLYFRVHYRAPLAFSWKALEDAGGELRSLVEAGRALLSLGRTAANPTGIHAYRRRFNAALENDLDVPAALGALWDGLRPGALSPGSRLELLRLGDSAFKLSIFRGPESRS